MKKVLISLLAFFTFFAGQAQITVTVGSALLQNPGTMVHLPVTVNGLNGSSGGVGVTGIELHISYESSAMVYDTTLNFSSLTPTSQWFFGGNGIEYSTNWLEPSGNKLNLPDNTVLFDIVFQYLGGITALTCDTSRCLLFDSAYNIIEGVHYVNGQVTSSQGSGESRWNGTGPWNTLTNWSNGIPGDSTNAIIETGQVTTLSNAVCKSITINTGSMVVIPANFSLTANLNYTNDGILNLQSDAMGTGSLIVRGTTSGRGDNNFGRYLDLDSDKPSIVSSPVSGATASMFGANVAEKYLESSSSWVTLAASEILETASGYRIGGSSPTNVTFQGIFHTADVTRSNLSYSGGSQSVSQGLNLLGNPYPSAIQWEQGNWVRTNLDYAVYVWSDYKYVSWNGSIGSLHDGIIPAMQGFYVKCNASGASLSIPSGARLHSSEPFYKTSDAMSNMLTMKIMNTTDLIHYDEAYVHILAGSTSGFDSNHDAWKLTGNSAHPQIFTKATDQSNLSINTQPEFVSVPVEFSSSTPGSYKIIFGNIESFNSSQPLFFEDKANNTVINIRNASDYVFTSTGTAEAGRFLIHFQEVGIGEQPMTIFSVWNTDLRIHISPKTGENYIDQWELYSLTGQLMLSGANLILPAAIAYNHLNTGIYFLRLKTKEGVYTHKLMVK